MQKPLHLNPGDTVMALSLSRGGPGTIPARYEAGKQELEKQFGVKVIEGKHTLKSAERLYQNPQARAQDLMDAFSNPDVKAIFSTIGGEESIRILPYIDFEIIKNNPKIFLGFSDTTISHFICQKAGIVSFYGPSIMAGFAESRGMFAYSAQSVRKTLFSNEPIGEIVPNSEGRTSEFLSRSDPQNQNKKRRLQKNTGRRRIQGSGIVEGRLIGGCIDVFPFMQGTKIRPSIEDWKGKILCIETSEEKMSQTAFERIIRNLGSQGILQQLNGILLGRAEMDYEIGIQIDYDDSLLKIITGEFGLKNLPIVTNMDFGHTEPMFVIPLGCNVKIDCDQKELFITESGCS